MSLLMHTSDHYGETAAKAVRAYVELCIVTRIGKELRVSRLCARSPKLGQLLQIGTSSITSKIS